MDFKIKDWRRIYDQIHRLGQDLYNSYPHQDENGRWYDPAIVLSKYAQEELKHEIEILIKKNNCYLDACGMKKRKPLWKYIPKDPTTWASDPTFSYGHLIKIGA